MESSLGCSRGQRVFGPAHRLGQWQRVEVSEGGTPADVTAVQRPPFTPRMCCYEMMTTAACHPRVEGGLLVVLEWPAMRDHGAEKRPPSQGEEFGMCNWDRVHVPPEVIRPRIGRHEDCRERQPCQCRHGYGPYASAHRVCHGSREAPSARPAPLASVLLFLDTGCQGGLKRNKQRTCTPSARPLSARGLGRLRGSDHPQRLWRQRCRLAAHSFRGSGSRPSGNRVKRRRLAQRRAFEEAESSGVLAQRWGGLL